MGCMVTWELRSVVVSVAMEGTMSVDLDVDNRRRRCILERQCGPLDAKLFHQWVMECIVAAVCLALLFIGHLVHKFKWKDRC